MLTFANFTIQFNAFVRSFLCFLPLRWLIFKLFFSLWFPSLQKELPSTLSHRFPKLLPRMHALKKEEGKNS